MEAVEVAVRESAASPQDASERKSGDSIRQRALSRPTLSQAEWAKFEEDGRRIRETMKAAGVTEDQILEDFQQMKREERTQRNSAG